GAITVRRRGNEIDEFATAGKGERLLVDEREVLALGRAVSQCRLTLHAEHSKRKAPYVGRTVSRAVHAAVGKPHPDVVIARLRKQAVPGELGQAVQHLEYPLR